MEETTTEWQRSSYCGDNACIEVATLGAQVLMRDSKNPQQPHLSFSSDDWNTFLDRVASGQAL